MKELEPLEIVVSNGDGTVSKVTLVKPSDIEVVKDNINFVDSEHTNEEVRLNSAINAEKTARENEDTKLRDKIQAARSINLAKPLEDDNLLLYFDTMACDNSKSIDLAKSLILSDSVNAYGFIPKEDTGRGMYFISNSGGTSVSKCTGTLNIANGNVGITGVQLGSDVTALSDVPLNEYLGFNDLYYNSYSYPRLTEFSISFMANFQAMSSPTENTQLFKLGKTRYVSISQKGYNGIRMLVNLASPDRALLDSGFIRPTYGFWQFFTATFSDGIIRWYINGQEIACNNYLLDGDSMSDENGVIRPFVDGGLYFNTLARSGTNVASPQLAYLGLHNRCLTQSEIIRLYNNRLNAYYLTANPKNLEAVIQDLCKRVESIENGDMFILY